MRSGFWRLVLLMLCSPLVLAEQSPQSIEAAVGRHLLEVNRQAGREGVTIDEVNVDARLRLAECGEPLQAFLPPGGRSLGRVTVGVRCTTPRPWSLYLQARVGWRQPVVISSRPLTRGQVVGRDDLLVEQRDVAEMSSGFFTSPDELVGMVASRSIAGAMPLSPPLLKPPLLVRRGERVSIIAVSGSLEVRMAGEALQDGAKGERIRVRNLSSRQEVQGEVVAAGLVKVPM